MMITAKQATRSQNHQTEPNWTTLSYTPPKHRAFHLSKCQGGGVPSPQNPATRHIHTTTSSQCCCPTFFLANPAPGSFTTLPLFPNQLGSGPQPKLTQTKLHSAPPHLLLLLQPYPPPPKCPKVPPFSLPSLPPSVRSSFLPSFRLVPLGVLE